MQVVVGRVGRAHGIRGQVTVEVRTDDPEGRLGPGAVLATEPPSTGPLTVAEGRVHSGRLLLRFEGVDDRTAAEALRGTLLLADASPDDTTGDDDEFFDHQLVGLAAVLADGTRVGEVAEMLHLPGQDLVAVRRADGRELLIPFVAEMVPEIDPSAGRIVLAPPPGLLELDDFGEP